ncbi:MAG: hypothetical protein O7G85_15235 [Planctomycetota bacterium]|nr:hypothetical protein [Planctomycetota bacterium]
MFAKLILIILAAGAIASSLLVLRQQKVETIHEISRAYQRQRVSEQTLWLLQAEIARRVRPEALNEKLRESELNWLPIPAIPVTLDQHAIAGAESLTNPGE